MNKTSRDWQDYLGMALSAYGVACVVLAIYIAIVW